jgi:flagellin-like hook-associated protein FlgL
MSVSPIYARTTMGMQSSALLRELASANSGMFVTQQQLATGKRIQTISQDALGSTQYISHTGRSYRNAAYLSAVSDLTSGYNFIDSQLNDGSGVINQLKQIALRESNDGASDANSRSQSVTEVSNLRQALLAFANGKYKGLSMFGGRNTGVEPFASKGDAFIFSGTKDVNQRLVGDGFQFDSSLSAADVFGDIQTVSSARNDLNAALNLQLVSPPGQPQVSTPLSALNGGRGVDLGLMTVIVYPDGATTTGTARQYTVDLRQAKTISDVAVAFNNVKGADGNSAFDATVYSGHGPDFPQGADSIISGLRISAAGEVATAINGRPSEIRFLDQEGHFTSRDLGLVTGQIAYQATTAALTGPFNAGPYNFSISANGVPANISVTPGGAQTLTDLAAAMNTAITQALNAAGMSNFDVTVGDDGTGLTFDVADAAGTGSFSLTGTNTAAIPVGDAYASGSISTAVSFNRAAGSFSSGSFAGRDLDPAITINTALNTLNGGAGLRPALDAAGATVVPQGLSITNGSLSGDINMADLLASSSATIGDLINRINGSGLEVEARLADSGDRLEIVSRLVGVPLKVDNLNGSIATQLGFDSRFSEMQTSDLNDGAGLTLVDGADFRAITSTGKTIDFDLGDAKTVSDVVSAINNNAANTLNGGGNAFTARAVTERSLTGNPLSNTLFGAGGISPVSFNVSINGGPQRTVSVTGPFATRDALAASVETAFNNLTAQLGLTGFSTRVHADNASGGLNFQFQDESGAAAVDFSGGNTALLGLEGSPNNLGVRTFINEQVKQRFLLTDNTFATATFTPGSPQPVLQNLGDSSVLNELGLVQSDAKRVQTVGAAPAVIFNAANAFSLTVNLTRGPALTVNVGASAGRDSAGLASAIQTAFQNAISAAGIQGYTGTVQAAANGTFIVETTDAFDDASVTFTGADATTLGLTAAQTTVAAPVSVVYNTGTGEFEGKSHALRGTASDNIFTVMNNLIAALESNNTGAIANTLGGFGTSLNRLLSAQSEAGSRVQRLDLASNRLIRENETLKELSAKIMDTDLAEAATKLAQQQTIFQAGIQATAKILRVSVLDYL